MNILTEEDRKIILASDPGKESSLDICGWVEDMLLHRPLTENERRDLLIKCKYWCLLSAQKQHLEILESFKSLATEYGYKTDYRNPK